MLLGNWDGGMFPGQPRRQRTIVHGSCGRSPRASQSSPECPKASQHPWQGQSRSAHPRPQEVAEGIHLQDTSTAAQI